MKNKTQLSDLPSHSDASKILSRGTDCCRQWRTHRKNLQHLARQLRDLGEDPQMMLQYSDEAYEYNRSGHCDGHIEDVEDYMTEELDNMYRSLGINKW